VGQQGLDVAAALEVELLLVAALHREADAGLARQALRQGAVDCELRVAALAGKLLGGAVRRAVVLRVHVLRRVRDLLLVHHRVALHRVVPLVVLRLRSRRGVHAGEGVVGAHPLESRVDAGVGAVGQR
jgi:hypothetical protein